MPAAVSGTGEVGDDATVVGKALGGGEVGVADGEVDAAEQDVVAGWGLAVEDAGVIAGGGEYGGWVCNAGEADFAGKRVPVAGGDEGEVGGQPAEFVDDGGALGGAFGLEALVFEIEPGAPGDAHGGHGLAGDGSAEEERRAGVI